MKSWLALGCPQRGNMILFYVIERQNVWASSIVVFWRVVKVSLEIAKWLDFDYEYD